MPLLDKETSTRLLFSPDAEKDIQHAQKEILQNKEKLTNKELVKLWATIAKYYMWKKESEKCKHAYLECASIIQSTEDTLWLGECYIDLGDSLNFCGDYEKALNYFNEVLSIIRPFKSTDTLAHLYNQMAYSSANIGDREQERKYLSDALELPLDRLIKATLIERIAFSYYASGKLEISAKHYEEALSIFETEHFKRNWEDRINILIEIYHALGDESSAQRTSKRK